MRHATLYLSTLLLVFVTLMASPATADPDKRSMQVNIELGGRTVRVTPISPDEETRTFQRWFNNQLRGYGEIDEFTGERISDLIQVVTDVYDGRIVVRDARYRENTVTVTRRTRLTFEPLRRSWSPPVMRGQRGLPADPDRADRLRPGDLVIVEGYLRASGGMAASRIRVVGQAWGWGWGYGRRDDDGYGREQRIHGTVIDAEGYGTVQIVDTNIGRKRIMLRRGGNVYINESMTTPFSLLSRGDRIVIYYRVAGRDTIEATRVCRLRWNNDRFPSGDAPFYTDTWGRANEYYSRDDRRDDRGRGRDDDDGRDLAEITGRLYAVSTGTYYNTIVLVNEKGKQVEFRLAKEVLAIDKRGNHLALMNLRDGVKLRVRYLTFDDEHLGQFVDIVE